VVVAWQVKPLGSVSPFLDLAIIVVVERWCAGVLVGQV